MGKYEKKLKQWYSAPGVESVLAMHAREVDAEIATLQREKAELEESEKALVQTSKNLDRLAKENYLKYKELMSENNTLVERVKVHNASMIAHRHGMYLISLD